MKYHWRRQLRFGPLRINLTQRGLSSFGLGAGRWSWNSRTRRHTVDTPGPGWWTFGGKRGRSR